LPQAEAIRIKSGMQKVEKLERQRDQLLRQASKLDRKIAKMSGGNGTVITATRRRRKPGRRKGFKVSAATRRKMSEAAKRRNAGNGKVAAPAGKKRRTMSAATLAKMAAAAKARWAKVKGASSPKARP
jgi:hypothetical protein